MDRNEINLRTISEIDATSGDFLISCSSDTTSRPAIFKSDVLDKEKIIDNVNGKEGELLLSYVGDKSGEINDDGELILNSDDADSYTKQDENLIYNE